MASVSDHSGISVFQIREETVRNDRTRGRVDKRIVTGYSDRHLNILAGGNSIESALLGESHPIVEAVKRHSRYIIRRFPLDRISVCSTEVKFGRCSGLLAVFIKLSYSYTILERFLPLRIAGHLDL